MAWWDLARMQSGVVSRAQLLGHGLSASAVHRMLVAQELYPMASGVYLVRGAPLTYRARLWVAVIGTGGVLGFATAARLWGLDGVEDAGQIHVVIPTTQRAGLIDGVTLHRLDLPRPAVRERDGLPITARGWSVLDHLTTLEPQAASQLLDRAVQRGWLSTADIDERLRDFPKRRGNPRLRRLRPMTTDGAAAESERRLHRILRSAGITGWTPNYPLWAGGDLVGVIDVALVARRVAIEVDGMAHHVDADRFQHDRTRQNQLTALGWTVLRFTWSDLVDRPGYVVAMIRRLAA